MQPTYHLRAVGEVLVSRQLEHVGHRAPIALGRLPVLLARSRRLIALNRRDGIFDRDVVSLDAVRALDSACGEHSPNLSNPTLWLRDIVAQFPPQLFDPRERNLFFECRIWGGE